MSKVQFKKEVLSLLNELTTLNKSIIFEKIDDKVVVRRYDDSTTVVYFLSLSNEDVSFEGDKIAFYNYLEFYQLFQALENQEIDQVDNKLVISNKSSKIKYLLSDPETIKGGPKNKAEFETPQFSFKMTRENLKEIKKMISLIDAKLINFGKSDESLVIKIYKDKDHDTSFEKIYEFDVKSDGKLNLSISADLFTKIPDNEYKVEIKDGIVKLNYINDKLSLELYTAEIEE